MVGAVRWGTWLKPLRNLSCRKQLNIITSGGVAGTEGLSSDFLLLWAPTALFARVQMSIAASS